MKNFTKRKTAAAMDEHAQLQEIDERHLLAQQIFFRREDREWSQERLAAEAGLTQAQVATLEAGQGNPTLRTLVKLASAFGCPLRKLFEPLDERLEGSVGAEWEPAAVLGEDRAPD